MQKILPSTGFEDLMLIKFGQENLQFLGKELEVNALAAMQPTDTIMNKIIRDHPYNKSHNIKWISDEEVKILQQLYPDIDEEAFEDNFTYLNYPEGICCKDDYVYIADTDNSVIKVYNITPFSLKNGTLSYS